MSGEPVGRFEWEGALRETPGVSMPLRGVLSTMATYADYRTGENIRPSLSRLAEDLKVGRSTLTKYVGEGARLEWLGCTEDNGSRGKPSVYQLTRPEPGGARVTSHPLPIPEPEGDRETRQGVPATRGRGDRQTRQGVPVSFRTTSSGTSSSTSSSTSSPCPQHPEGCPAPHGAAAWDFIEQMDSEAQTLAMAKAPAFD